MTNLSTKLKSVAAFASTVLLANPLNGGMPEIAKAAIIQVDVVIGILFHKPPKLSSFLVPVE